MIQTVAPTSNAGHFNKNAVLTHSMSKLQKVMLVASACMAVLHIIADYLFFDLKTVQGHLYVIAMEIALQVAIYAMATPKSNFPSIHPGRPLAILSLANVVAAGYKALFVVSLASTPAMSDFTDIFTFASGGAYRLAPIADGYADVIANAMYQCGMCVPGTHVPLSEPFIAYIFVVISFIAGEFNQHILWLTLQTVNFAAAVVLLKIALRFFPSARFSWALPVIYILLFDVHGVTLRLFKDGLVAFVLICLFYTNARLLEKDKPRVPFELLSVLLIVLLYNLRTGTLPAILCLSVLHCVFDRKRWLLHVRVLVTAMVSIIALGNFEGFSDKLERSLTRTTDKAMYGSGKHLDIQNLTYTTTRENSLFHKLKLHEVTPSNFFYAPLVKGTLYFLLPLPVTKFVNRADSLHKLSTTIYFALFSLLIIGIFGILKNRTREEVYLLAVFGLFVVLILGAGPMLLPRYRIMVSPFFLLIAMLGASRISNRLVGLNIGLSAAIATGIVIWYDDLYNLIQSLT
jgi:hypothetical protein